MGDEEEDETTRSRFRLYRVRRTVLQILRDRGYMVASADLEMTEEQFREKFTDVPQREQLAILVQKRDDPTDQLFVFWPADPKVGVKPIKRYVERMGEDDVKRAILVVQESMTAFAKTAMLEIMAAQGVSGFVCLLLGSLLYAQLVQASGRQAVETGSAGAGIG